jgi:hypothetical protein
MKKLTRGLAALLTLACSACGHAQLQPVSGRVTYMGSPAPGATVCLQRRAAESEHIIMGTVQPDGTFELTCGSMGKGAPVGEYDVLIVWKAPCPKGNCGCERLMDKLQGRYADRKSPRFQVAIRAGRNELGPFNLTE